MRVLSLGIMASASGGMSCNPFDRFALGSAAVASASGSAADSPPFAQIATAGAQVDLADERRAKKRMRVAVITTAAVGGCGRSDITSGLAAMDGSKGLVEKYRSPNELEWPLRLVVVGHNPSETAWRQGHYYANPSNRMYKLLATAKIIPDVFTASDDDKCPIACGVGFTDVGFSIPGTDSSEFKRTDLHAWRQGFYERLIAHAQRAARTVAAAAAAGEESGETALAVEESTVDVSLGYPQIVAFAGKRQWEELFHDASKETKVRTKGGKNGAFKFGLQPSALSPPGWPFPAGSTEIFVVPSSSGAAAMTTAAREGPYIDLGKRVQDTGPWTRNSASTLSIEKA